MSLSLPMAALTEDGVEVPYRSRCHLTSGEGKAKCTQI